VITSKPRWDLDAQGKVPSWRRGLVDNQLAATVARIPNGIAIVAGDRQVTWAELDDMATRAANGILAAGARPRDVVGLRAHNAPETLAAFYGLARAGITVLPMSPRLVGAELSWQLGDVDAVKLIDDDGLGDVTVAELVAAGSSTPVDVEVDPQDYIWVRFTSGTTGRPKAVATTHDSAAFMWEALAHELQCGPTEVTLVTAPIAHAALAPACCTVLTGGTMVVEPGFDGRTVWETVDRHGVTLVFMVPTMFALSLDSPGSGASIRTILSMASIFTPSLMAKVKGRFPQARLLDGYAGTELGLATLLRYDENPDKAASVGRPAFGNKVKILDDDGNEVPRGEVGTIYLQGRPLCAAFVGSQPPSPNTTRDGFLTVGDLGYVDDDGFLFLVDRRTDLIITGGFNVYPSEVENVIQTHPGVRTVAVVGVPDETWGNIVTAVIEGTAPREELEVLCREKLAGYKVPRRWEYVDALPLNASGKVLKRELRQRYASPPAPDQA
jgi:acyl-CoA synthetase (AMP-forming)/AMP-acid ligase II